jgi:hypothetical protein
MLEQYSLQQINESFDKAAGWFRTAADHSDTTLLASQCPNPIPILDKGSIGTSNNFMPLWPVDGDEQEGWELIRCCSCQPSPGAAFLQITAALMTFSNENENQYRNATVAASQVATWQSLRHSHAQAVCRPYPARIGSIDR